MIIYLCSEYLHLIESVHIQANCYAATLNALSLTEEKYAWVIKPVEPDEVCIICLRNLVAIITDYCIA